MAKTISLRDITYFFFYTLFKRKWLFILSFIVVAAGVVFYGIITTPVFKINTTILVLQNPKPQMILFKDITTPAPSRDYEKIYPALNLKEFVTSQTLSESIVKKLGLDLRFKEKRLHPKIFRDRVKSLIADLQDLPFIILDRLKILPMEPKDWVRKATEELMEDVIEVGVLPETEIVNINVYHEDAKLGLAISNAIVEKVEKMAIHLESQKSSQHYVFTKGEVEKQSKTLKKVEDTYINFRETENIVDLTRERDLLLNRLDDIKAKAMDAERQIASQTAKLTEIETLIKSEEPRAHISRSSDKQELDGIKGGSTQEGPRLKPGWNQSYLELKKEAAECQIAIGSQKDLLSVLNVQIKGIESRVASIPGKELLLHRLERDRDNEEKLYQGLYDKKNQLQVQKMSDTTEFDIKVINPPSIPAVPDTYWPEWDLMSLIAVGSGILGGLLMVFIVDQFSGTFSDKSQLERLAEIKVLGSIPDLSKRKLRALRRAGEG